MAPAREPVERRPNQRGRPVAVIFDAHNHCFQPLGKPYPDEDMADRIREHQYHLRFHAQGVRRLRDNADRTTLNPDCGFAPNMLNPIPLDEAYGKLKAQSEAARELRRRHGGEDSASCT